MGAKTPLYDFHTAQGCRIVEFGGWDMPVSYTGIIEEHMAVRTAVGLFDVSHMGEFVVTGVEAEAFLDNLLTNRIAGLSVGKAVYSPMCAPDGGVVDDLIVYRTGESSFLVCVNASNIDKDFAWFEAHVQGFAVVVENHSAEYALLALQGPRAEDLLASWVSVELPALKRFHHVEATLDEIPVRICRTGYTGEDGFEIYCNAQDGVRLATTLLEAGRACGLKLCGLGARDSLRMEAGYPLYGHEISDELNPLQGGIGWTVKFEKAAFIGKDALAACQQTGVNPRVVHFTLEGRRIAREGSKVFANGKEVGSVVSGTMSPVLGRPIGAAAIHFEDVDTSELYVDLRGHQLVLNVCRPPLHKLAHST